MVVQRSDQKKLSRCRLSRVAVHARTEDLLRDTQLTDRYSAAASPAGSWRARTYQAKSCWGLPWNQTTEPLEAYRISSLSECPGPVTARQREEMR